MSWWSSFSRLWSKGPEASDDQSASDALRRSLSDEQRALASDVESLFRAYDAKLQSLSQRLKTLDDDALEAEAADIRATQDAIRRLLRRVEVSAKSSRELERELAGWESRLADAPYHADHPEVRAEMARSELASRNPGSVVGAHARHRPPVVQVADRTEGRTQGYAPTELDDEPDLEAIPFLAASDALPDMSVEHLLQAIREATHEAERWHAVPVEDCDEEVLVQIHHVRDLHALLKEIDREQGIRRDRVELAVATRE